MLKVNESYTTMDVMDTAVVIGKDASAYMPNILMTLNETGIFLWKQLEMGTDEISLVKSLEDTYSLSHEKAEADVAHFLHQLQERNLLKQ